MRKLVILKYLGKVLIVFGLLLTLPVIVAIAFRENPNPFVITMIISFSIGWFLNGVIDLQAFLFSKDAIVIVALSWVVICLLGALPFYLNCNISFLDALLESTSGFTTTGISIFTDVESLDNSILFWRSYTQFIGGLGILAIVMLTIPLDKEDKSVHILETEMSSLNTIKLVPNIKKTLVYLYGIYGGLMFLQIILLMLGKLNFFDSLLLSMGTAATGGFAIFNDGVSSLSSYNQIIIAIFMLAFGINFKTYFFILIKHYKRAFDQEELKMYWKIIIVFFIILAANSFVLFGYLGQTLKMSFFYVSSAISSTGFTYGNINYSTQCQWLLMVLMFIGACSGSTGGGVKISRILICRKMLKKELIQLVNPSRIYTITYNHKSVSEETYQRVSCYLFASIILIILSTFILGLNNLNNLQSFNVVIATFTNSGISFNFNDFINLSSFSKVILNIIMLMGRLEIYPLIVLPQFILSK